MSKVIALTGASGFIGRALVRALVERGHRVVALGRRPSETNFGPGVITRHFDPNSGAPQPAAFAGVDAVVHLAGETVAGRWNAEKKRAIYQSRVLGTRALVESLQALPQPPGVLVSASASGYYGSRGDEVLLETSPAGDDFLARVCADWEREAAQARDLGVRVASLRTGLVLGDGGALQSMLPPFRLGAGGPFGSGRQFAPWIHIDDLVALYIFAIERDDIHGPVNAVAPDYATSARFAQALGHAIGRPAVIPAPGLALQAMLGEFGQTLLASQLMLPAVAEDAGFSWRHDNLEEALIAILGSGRRSGVRCFQDQQFVRASLDDVFGFFSSAHNLEEITPASLRFAIASVPQALRRGAQIAYRLRLHGIPFHWKTMIAQWNPPHGFVDVQLHGPYALWRHAHTFTPVPGGVLIGDDITYALPPAGSVVAPIVENDVRSIFEHRRSCIQRLFGEEAERASAV